MTVVWGAVCRAKQGQQVSGDIYTVLEERPGRYLTAVIDGLGGGEEAARAANLAHELFQLHPGLPLQELVRRAHTALHSTRGAVVGLLRLDLTTTQASYIGVGNIGVHVYSRRPIKPISKNGILGYRLPTLLELQYTFDLDDIFVLYSDGVSAQFSQNDRFDLRQPPQQLAEQILHSYGKHTDDATVVVLKASQ